MSTILYKNHKVLCDSMCYITVGNEVHHRIGAKKMFVSECGRMVFAAIGTEYEQADVDKIFEAWGPKWEQFYLDGGNPGALVPKDLATLAKEAWRPYVKSDCLLFTREHVVAMWDRMLLPQYHKLEHSFSIGSASGLSSMLLQEDLELEKVAELIHRRTSVVMPPYKAIDLTTLNVWERE